MTCYHPLRAVCTGVTDKGKRSLKILKNNDPEANIPNVDYLSLPCGKCIGCRLEYSKNWADRCMLEALYHNKASFITLTYNDENLPPVNPLVDENGVVTGYSPIHSLVKSDFQKFMKRLRFHFGDERIRFFACGEYGSINMRPHYHAIIFGEDFKEDRSLFRRNFQSDSIYISDTLSSLWPFGFSTVCELSWNAAAYVARYCVKKQFGFGADVYKKYNYTPEFTLMSRKPGIARQYYDENKDKIYKNEEIFLALPDRSMKLKPSRYYDKLFDIDDPISMENIRNRRRDRAEYNQLEKSKNTSLHVLEQKQLEEYNLNQKVNIMKERRMEL